MRSTFVISCAVLLSGCTLPQSTRPVFAGALPSGVTLDLTGTFALLRTGDLTLSLRDGCKVEREAPVSRKVATVPCGRSELSAIRVVATPPWGGEIAGTWIDHRSLVFHVRWSESRLAVLAEDSTSMARRAWQVSGAQWKPTADDAPVILGLVGEATHTETTVVAGTEPPQLELEGFELEGSIGAGREASFAIKLANRGRGSAYRVVATTRSSMPALHGQRVEFGMVKPGDEKARNLRVQVPAGETAGDAMVVLVIEEAHGFAPPSVSRRWSVVVAQPELAVNCDLRDHVAGRPTISAGERVVVRCVVANVGAAPADASLEIAAPGGEVRTPPQKVPVGQRVVFEAPVVFARDLAIGSSVELAVGARDARLGRLAQTTLTTVVGKAKLCEVGKLTRKAYDAKIRELRAAVLAGDITQAQFDRYDRELLLCLR